MAAKSKKSVSPVEVALHPIVGPDGQQIYAGDPVPDTWDDVNKSALRDAGSIGPRTALGDTPPHVPGEIAPMATTDSTRVQTNP